MPAGPVSVRYSRSEGPTIKKGQKYLDPCRGVSCYRRKKKGKRKRKIKPDDPESTQPAETGDICCQAKQQGRTSPHEDSESITMCVKVCRRFTRWLRSSAAQRGPRVKSGYNQSQARKQDEN